MLPPGGRNWQLISPHYKGDVGLEILLSNVISIKDFLSPLIAISNNSNKDLLFSRLCKCCFNGKEAIVNIVLDGSTYPSVKLVHSVFGKINYGGLKHNSSCLGLVLPSGG